MPPFQGPAVDRQHQRGFARGSEVFRSRLHYHAVGARFSFAEQAVECPCAKCSPGVAENQNEANEA